MTEVKERRQRHANDANQIRVVHEVDRINRMTQSDLPKAGEAAEALAAEYPDIFEVQMVCAQLFYRQRRYVDMLRTLSVADRIRPKHGTVHFKLGVAHLELGDLGSAFRHFAASSEYVAPDVQMPLIMAGRCCHRLARPREAISYYGKVLQQNPANVQALTGMMFALRECGKFAEADIFVRRMQSIFAEDQRARNNYLHTNHYFGFVGWRRLDNKAEQKRAIAAYRAGNGDNAFPWMPETFIMPDEFTALEAAHAASPGYWFVKPTELFGGHGIRIIDTPGDVPPGAGYVVQRYVERPLLIRDRKSVIRLYVLITSAKPARFYLYGDGLVRFAARPYREDAIDELPRHIATRRTYEADSQLNKELRDAIGSVSLMWPISQFVRELQSMSLDVTPIWPALRDLARKFIAVVVSTGLLDEQVESGMQFAYGPKIIGLDVQLDCNLKPWFLEMETNPGAWPMVAASNGKILDNFIDMTVFPLLDPDKEVMVTVQRLKDRAYCAARIAELEIGRHGRFEPIALEFNG